MGHINEQLGLLLIDWKATHHSLGSFKQNYRRPQH